jgi:hypothetical protein
MNHRYRFLLLVLLAQALFLLNITLARHPHRHQVSTSVIDVDARNAAPVEIKADKGSEVIFVRKTGIVGTDVSLSQENADGGNTPLLTVESARPAVPAGYTLVSSYRVDRAGSANIIVTHTVPMPGAKPWSDAIKVTGR